MPLGMFDSIITKEDLISFLDKNFKDFLKLAGEDIVINDYFNNPKGNLVSSQVY